MQQIQIPPLAEGEIYVGSIGDAQGNLHHVILLPGDNDDATWSAQMAWAESIGGDLPTRIELAMLWANRRDQFPRVSKVAPSPAGLGISSSSTATRTTTTCTTSSGLVPSADCQFNHLVISRTP